MRVLFPSAKITCHKNSFGEIARCSETDRIYKRLMEANNTTSRSDRSVLAHRLNDWLIMAAHPAYKTCIHFCHRFVYLACLIFSSHYSTFCSQLICNFFLKFTNLNLNSLLVVQYSKILVSSIGNIVNLHYRYVDSNGHFEIYIYKKKKKIKKKKKKQHRNWL